MHLIDCEESHGGAILAILNEAIAHSTALYDYKPRTMEMMGAWFEAKRKGNFPVIGAVSETGELMGFASYGTFRAWPGYKYTVEHSVYVEQRFRGRGVGKFLLRSVVERAVAQDFHVMIGGIDSSNVVSIGLHEAFGFRLVGRLPEVGFKFGEWRDLCFYQLTLKTPAAPVDG